MPKKKESEIKILKEKLKRKTKQLEVLKEIIETISYNLDLNEVLNRVLKIVKDITQSDSCFLYLLEKNYLVLKASQNPRPAFTGKLKLKIGEGITGWVAKEKKTVCIKEKAYKDKRFKLIHSLPEDKYEAFLSVPITFRDKLIGVMNIQHIKKREYSPEEISLVEMIAKEIGGAIEISRLITETNILREALETRKLVDRAKAILIKDYGMQEDEAHKFLLKKSMDKRKPLKEIAEAIILASEIKKEK